MRVVVVIIVDTILYVMNEASRYLATTIIYWWKGVKYTGEGEAGRVNPTQRVFLSLSPSVCKFKLLLLQLDLPNVSILVFKFYILFSMGKRGWLPKQPRGSWFTTAVLYSDTIQNVEPCASKVRIRPITGVSTHASSTLRRPMFPGSKWDARGGSNSSRNMSCAAGLKTGSNCLLLCLPWPVINVKSRTTEGSLPDKKKVTNRERSVIHAHRSPLMALTVLSLRYLFKFITG